nr:hypothetical protein [Tanacetum cinerariifolium]
IEEGKPESEDDSVEATTPTASRRPSSAVLADSKNYPLPSRKSSHARESSLDVEVCPTPRLVESPCALNNVPDSTSTESASTTVSI